MIKLLQIDSCDDCKHNLDEGDRLCTITSPWRIIPPKEFKWQDKTPIPEFCELENEDK